MKRYSALIIESSNIYNFFENTAEGIIYCNLSKEELDKLLELSLKQNFSVVVRNYGNEE